MDKPQRLTCFLTESVSICIFFGELRSLRIINEQCLLIYFCYFVVMDFLTFFWQSSLGLITPCTLLGVLKLFFRLKFPYGLCNDYAWEGSWRKRDKRPHSGQETWTELMLLWGWSFIESKGVRKGREKESGGQRPVCPFRRTAGKGKESGSGQCLSLEKTICVCKQTQMNYYVVN